MGKKTIFFHNRSVYKKPLIIPSNKNLVIKHPIPPLIKIPNYQLSEELTRQIEQEKYQQYKQCQQEKYQQYQQSQLLRQQEERGKEQEKDRGQELRVDKILYLYAAGIIGLITFNSVDKEKLSEESPKDENKVSSEIYTPSEIYTQKILNGNFLQYSSFHPCYDGKRVIEIEPIKNKIVIGQECLSYPFKIDDNKFSINFAEEYLLGRKNFFLSKDYCIADKIKVRIEDKKLVVDIYKKDNSLIYFSLFTLLFLPLFR